MAWVTIPGLKGLVYVPDDAGQQTQKHPCSTCYACQWCDETRCRVCRDGGSGHAEDGSRHCCSSKETASAEKHKLQTPNHK